MRSGIAVLAAAALFGVAALAFGQDVVPIKWTASVKVTPNKAGTPSHPRNVVVDLRARIHIPSDYDPPLIQSVTVWIGPGGIYNGAKLPVCDFQKLRRSGPKACPARSIVGHATVTASADGVKTYPKITIVNGGATKFYFYGVLNYPARLREAVPVTVTRLTSGPWKYRWHFEIPRRLQIVAGIPLRAEAFHGLFGRGNWLVSTSCPRDRRWRGYGEVRYSSGQVVSQRASSPCRS
ncbi:MAG: hypothetical protein ABUM26_05845 [Solirubrobacterales bacterium]